MVYVIGKKAADLICEHSEDRTSHRLRHMMGRVLTVTGEHVESCYLVMMQVVGLYRCARPPTCIPVRYRISYC